MRMRADLISHRLMALQATLIRIHFRFQLSAARPFRETDLVRIPQMHLVARNARELSTAKTWRSLDAVEFPAGHPDHAVSPEPIFIEVWLGLPNEFLLLKVIR